VSLREPRYLVVGADGLVGTGLVSLLEKIGVRVTGTTRRPEMMDAKNRMFLDLANINSKVILPSGYSVAFLFG
jgi:uncharacterized protein YbjT (DUF2867 family)